jgi:hypothetical protein
MSDKALRLGIEQRRGLPPVRRYPLGGINRIARKQFHDRGKRQLQLTQHHN